MNGRTDSRVTDAKGEYIGVGDWVICQDNRSLILMYVTHFSAHCVMGRAQYYWNRQVLIKNAKRMLFKIDKETASTFIEAHTGTDYEKLKAYL
jgi:hypothetical protein